MRVGSIQLERFHCLSVDLTSRRKFAGCARMNTGFLAFPVKEREHARGT